MLTSHNGSIPENEIWIKIGEGHGKNSLKFTLQIANTEKPNTCHNTVVIAIALVKDTLDNTVRFIQGAEDVTAIKELENVQEDEIKKYMIKLSPNVAQNVSLVSEPSSLLGISV
ncbi:amine oxidase [Plakobranchus ocellatus]|uniref:Amine oxidase n=1 Tax=Plakobranchus ocellatus TaxID=259542 RepID=A0AAV4BK61_9GAST|nr:amine oxidase [Plakobranchus ocellatus]